VAVISELPRRYTFWSVVVVTSYSHRAHRYLLTKITKCRALIRRLGEENDLRLQKEKDYLRQQKTNALRQQKTNALRQQNQMICAYKKADNDALLPKAYA
jgi:hypothetical protein